MRTDSRRSSAILFSFHQTTAVRDKTAIYKGCHCSIVLNFNIRFSRLQYLDHITRLPNDVSQRILFRRLTFIIKPVF